MVLKIENTCINCDVCEPACPNNAIYMGDTIYHIDPELCNECIGDFDVPQCQVLCPVDDCIIQDPDLPVLRQQDAHSALLNDWCQQHPQVIRSAINTLDAQFERCPLPLLTLKRFLQQPSQQKRWVHLIASDPHSVQDIGRFCQLKGHHVLDIVKTEPLIHFLIEPMPQ
jgi:TusA-related sulfurtransferase